MKKFFKKLFSRKAKKPFEVEVIKERKDFREVAKLSDVEATRFNELVTECIEQAVLMLGGVPPFPMGCDAILTLDVSEPKRHFACNFVLANDHAGLVDFVELTPAEYEEIQLARENMQKLAANELKQQHPDAN